MCKLAPTVVSSPLRSGALCKLGQLLEHPFLAISGEYNSQKYGKVLAILQYFKACSA